MLFVSQFGQIDNFLSELLYVQEIHRGVIAYAYNLLQLVIDMIDDIRMRFVMKWIHRRAIKHFWINPNEEPLNARGLRRRGSDHVAASGC